MVTWRPAPSLTAILHDADLVAPGRSHASDGTIGDAAHVAQAGASDHNPDARGVVHACDVTNDPAHGMDTWAWAQKIGGRMLSGAERRVEYLVSNNGQYDVILHPSVSSFWRQNGPKSQEHRSHLHVSIKYTLAAETDTSPFFSAVADTSGAGAPVPTPQEDPPMTLAELNAINQFIIQSATATQERVIGTLQTNMKSEWIPAITAGVAKATGADPQVIAAAVAHELAKKLDAP